jgi:hypothetical protein
MNSFKTLLQREWMQHQRGWIVLMALPLAIYAALALFGSLHFDGLDGFDSEQPMGTHGPTLVAFGAIAGIATLTLGLAWLASMIQSPGLARRDVQDRSIEFWLSLPISHLQSLSAPLLVHLLLVPWTALLVGVGGGVVLSLLLVSKLFGVAAWFAVPWGTMIAALVMLTLRIALGLLLATLWLLPLILGTMAASAWFKRWGVPLVVGVLSVGGPVLNVVYGQSLIVDALGGMWTHARHAFIAADGIASTRSLTIHSPDQIGDLLHALPGWALADGGHAIAALASPAFLCALLFGAAAFGLLWLRRQRGA